MNATISLQNIDNTLLNAIKAVLKTHPSVKYKISKKDEQKKVCESEECYYSEEAAARILAELAETKADFLAGKIKAYESSAEFRRAVENGEI